MKTLLCCCLLVILCNQKLQAQNDTIFTLFNADWKEIKARDSATYISKIFKEGDHYQRNDYWIQSMQLQSAESYSDATLKVHSGPSKWYNEKGVLVNINAYTNNKISQSDHFFDNGNRKASAAYDAEGKTKLQVGWDENGKEIPHFIFEEAAHFPGGLDGWREYLEKKINNKTAVKAGAPLGVYTVKVQFVVGKQGEIAKAEAVNVPPQCPPCGEEAVKIIKGSPRWKPAIQFNNPVIYQAIQNITWSVEN